MKVVKVLGIILALIVLALVVLSITGPEELKYEQTVEINAPVETTWEMTNSLEDMDKWSPWSAKATDNKQTFEGEPGTVGSKNCWESSDEEVGAGCQEIVAVDAPNRLETKLNFTRPMESEAGAFVSVEPMEGGSKVTWGFSSENSFMGRVMFNFMDFGAMMKEDFTNGLNKLKEMAEDAAEAEAEAEAAEEEMMQSDSTAVEEETMEEA
jgi:uncharacterized protein YndB with AHSA1/START domain